MKKTTIILIALSVLMIFNSSCSKDKVEIDDVITIGDQIWMTKNLNVEKFRNGDLIPQAKSDYEWELASVNKEPAWCYYNNLNSNGETYGKLYNWYAVSDIRGLAPNGFRVAKFIDFSYLNNFLYDDSIGTAIKIKSTRGWYFNSNGTNSSGFSALPSGNRMLDGVFDGIEKAAYWWCADTNSFGTPYSWTIGVSYKSYSLDPNTQQNKCGFPVRCIKDSIPL